MWEAIILWLIIIAAAVASIRSVYLTFAGKKTSCSCSNANCDNCQASQTPDLQLHQAKKPNQLSPPDKKA